MGTLKTTSVAAMARRSKRKIVDTPDGPFVIRKIQGSDFFAGGAVLPSGKNMEGKSAAEISEEIARDLKSNVTAYYNTLSNKGTVPDLVVKGEDGTFLFYSDYDAAPGPKEELIQTARVVTNENADPEANEVYMGDLEDETRLTLLAEIETHSGLGASLEERLKNFRDAKAKESGTDTKDRPTGEPLREASNGDSRPGRGGRCF